MRKSLTTVLFWIIALALPALAQAEETAGVEQAAEELAGLLRGYETYQARFIQIVVNENGSQVQETRGALKAKRPGLFY